MTALLDQPDDLLSCFDQSIRIIRRDLLSRLRLDQMDEGVQHVGRGVVVVVLQIAQNEGGRVQFRQQAVLDAVLQTERGNVCRQFIEENESGSAPGKGIKEYGGGTWAESRAASIQGVARKGRLSLGS